MGVHLTNRNEQSKEKICLSLEGYTEAKFNTLDAANNRVQVCGRGSQQRPGLDATNHCVLPIFQNSNLLLLVLELQNYYLLLIRKSAREAVRGG